MTKLYSLIIALTLSLFMLPAEAADSSSMDQQLSLIQSEWARIKYQVPDKDTQLKDLAKLEDNAAMLTSAFPDKAEPKIWQAIVLSTDAGVINGISALPKLKAAKALLETALGINPAALKGSAQTSLGSLYYQVPGWPISFGDNKKAEAYLTAALNINPDGIDPNYFYGDYLIQRSQYDKAILMLQHALQASPRPGREVADAGRHQEIKAAITKAQKALESSQKSTLNR
jgi:tetratricopeptide (TPR) repeat protein